MTSTFKNILNISIILIGNASAVSAHLNIEAKINRIHELINRRETFSHTTPEYRDLSNKINALSAEISRTGDEAIDPLISYCRTHPVMERSKMVTLDTIRNMNTPQARQILLKAALREGYYKLFSDSVAARLYLDMIKTPRDAVVLFKSKNTDIILQALNKCPGIDITRNLLNQLTGYLDKYRRSSRGYIVWFEVVNILKADPNDQFVREKIPLMVDSFESLIILPGMKKRYQQEPDTVADRMCRNLIDALIKMKGAPPLYKEFTPERKGDARTCFLIARGRHGDKSVKPDLRRLIPALRLRPTLRRVALEAFEKIGSVEDLDFLTDLAQNDPTVFIHMGGPMHFVIGENILNFELPERVSPEEKEPIEKMMRRDILQHPSKQFYLRPVARRIIQIIEKRKQTTANPQ